MIIALLLAAGSALRTTPPAGHHARVSGDHPQYRVVLDAWNADKLHVTARIMISDDSLRATEGTSRDPSLWSALIQNIQVRDTTGRGLPIGALHGRAWHLDAAYRGPAIVDYDVNLSFAHRPWPGGNQRAGLARDSALYIVTKALFLVGDTSVLAAHVAFVVPREYRVATPWTPDPGSLHSFSVPDYEALTVNSVLLGRFGWHVTHHGAFEMQVALLGDAEQAASTIAPALDGVIAQYVRMLPATPPTRYLLTLYYGDEDNGEAFSRSAAFVTQSRIRAGGAALWANTMAHELFHLWSPFLIKAADWDESAWLMEGFTEYFANRALLRSRVIDERQYLDYAGRHLGFYTYFRNAGIFDHRPLRTAGEEKTRFHFAVYDGGWTAALCLDLMIRERSNGARSIDDFMRSLMKRFPSTSSGYHYEDIVAVARELLPDDGDAFFAQFIDGTKQMPFRDLLSRNGFRVEAAEDEGVVFVTRDPRASVALAGRATRWLQR